MDQKESCPRCHGFMVPMIGDGSEAVVLACWIGVSCPAGAASTMASGSIR